MRKAFTLLEILLVIAALGILIVVVVSIINPWVHIYSLKDNQRLNDVNSLNLAISEYRTFVENLGLPSMPLEMCFTGDRPQGSVDCQEDLFDLSFLVPNHIDKIPHDPNISPELGQSNGYIISLGAGNRPYIKAYGELVEDIRTGSPAFASTPAPDETPDTLVVINEIMWMGSIDDASNLKPYDEWIELRNMTDYPISVGNWKIENARISGVEYKIPSKHYIPANGFFLVAFNPEVTSNTLITSSVDQVNASITFANDYSSNGQVVLKDNLGNVVDQTPLPVSDSSDWPAGEYDTTNYRAWSMERNDDPTTGWHTCDRSQMSASDLATMLGYWKGNAQNYNCGTPGAPNLSLNDPSSLIHVSLTNGEENAEE